MLNEYYIKGSNNNGILNLVPDVSLRGEPRKVISEKLEVPLFLRQFPLSPINNIPHKNDMMSHPKYTCRSEQGVNKYQLMRHYLYKPLGPIEIMAQLLNRHYENGGYLMNNNLFAPGEFPQKPDGEPQSQLQYIPDVGPLAYRPKMDSYGRAIMPTFTDVFGKDAKFFDPYPDVFLEEGSKNKNWTNYDAYREYYSRLKAFNEGKGPRDINASYDDAVNKEFDQPYNKVFLRTHHKYDFILSGGPTRRTDAVVRWSKNHGYDATDFHQLWDGDVTSPTGNYYSFPINERVLNPGAESFALPHGAPKKEVFKQILNSQDKIHFVPNIQSPVFPMLNPLIHNYYDSH